MINIIGEYALAENVNPRKNHKLNCSQRYALIFRIDHQRDERLLLSDMKKIFFAFLVSIFAFASQAQTNTATRYANLIKNSALYGLISTRCMRYVPQHKFSDCQRTVADMLKLIDSEMLFPTFHKTTSLDFKPQAFIFIAFKTTLIDLLNKESTTRYLSDVLLKVRDVNLWNLTLQHYPDPKVAAQVIAALFQDTSHVKLHIDYIERSVTNPSALFLNNKDQLEHAIDMINQLLDVNPEYFQKLLYPNGVNANLNKNIYHFYVPLYLGLALKQTGATAEMSYIAPMLMTLTYEFVTASSDYRYLICDPESLDPVKHAWKIKDIYAGHLGAAMSVGKKNLKSLEDLKKGFEKSTSSTVKSMLVL